MKAAYLPFTYLSESTACRLVALVGPVVVYQPIEKAVSSELSALASRGLVEIRTPLKGDDDRLCAALAEFTEWARMNPVRSTAGASYLGGRQGEVPFFDETAINRIRSDIRNYRDPGKTETETDDGFSSRLFLALAQENDHTVDSLDHDLDRFNTMEKDFLETLKDADNAGFNRRAYGSTLWREDPGSRLTGQRIRAWATLAAADDQAPDVLVTTSPAVIETLVEAGGFEKLADIRPALPTDATNPAMGRVLSELANGTMPLSSDLSGSGALAEAAGSDSAVAVSLYAAKNQAPENCIRQLAASTIGSLQPDGRMEPLRHTLIVLAQG